MSEEFLSSEDLGINSGSESIISPEKEDREYAFDGGIIVFGHGWSQEAKVGGGWQLSQEAYMRVVAAYELWKNGLAPRIILTGGQPGDWAKDKFGPEIKANSEQMAQLLIKKFKVPEEAIITEDQSFKTVDNVGHALNSLQERNLPTNNFLTVSTGYHMDRVSEIMNKFGLNSQPISAEEALHSRSVSHANSLREREMHEGKLSQEEIEKNYQANIGRYDRAIQRLKATNEVIQNEIMDEPIYTKAMKERPGFWLPLALSVRGDKLRELVETHKTDIQSWLDRHADLGITIEDLIAGNFDYKELVQKAREKAQ